MAEDIQLCGNNGEPVVEECTWAFDKSAFSKYTGVDAERSIGGAWKQSQYQQGAGSCENITVILTISADGSTLQPMVIYSGKAFQIKWLQDNPVKAKWVKNSQENTKLTIKHSLGYLKKGWMDREIGVEYAKDFELQTWARVKGWMWVLYANGHNSHFMLGFLDHCQAHNIKVPCYAAHGTHVYQGLNVVVFGPLKAGYAKEWKTHLRKTGETISKENFLTVYGKMHATVLQPNLIKTAFWKTGIFPFNRDIITSNMMAPSHSTCFKVFTPIEPSTPGCIVTNLLVDVLQPAVSKNMDMVNVSGDMNLIDPGQPLWHAVDDLSQLSLAFLTTESPIKLSAIPPDIDTMQLSPVQKCHLTMFKPWTSWEQQLADVLLAKDAKIQLLKAQTMKVQATMVLQQLYCKQVKSQLRAKESKQKKKGKKGGKLHSDGLSWVLTDDKFRNQVVEHQKAQAVAEAAKLTQQQACEERDLALENWRKKEEARKKRNEERYNAWKLAKAQWEEDRRVVKVSKGKLKDWAKENPKPKRNDASYKTEPAVPRPKVMYLLDEALKGILGRGDEESDNEDW